MHPLSMVRTRSTASLTPPTTSRAGVPPAPGLEHQTRDVELPGLTLRGQARRLPSRATTFGARRFVGPRGATRASSQNKQNNRRK
jgi:hypothetical protein